MKSSKTPRPVQLMAAGAFLVTASLAFADPAYELVIIEPWDDSYSLSMSAATGLNNLNQVSGVASSLPIGSSAPFLWTHEIGKSSINMAGKINDNGVIVKYGFVRWPDGTIDSLPAPLNGPGAINNENVVAGSTGAIYNCFTSGESQAVVWDPAGGVVLVEEQFGIADADEAWGINIYNQIVGIRANNGECGTHEAFHLDLNTGVYNDLHALLGSTGISRAFDIDDAGNVVGVGSSDETTFGPFLWNPDDGFTFLPAPPESLPQDTRYTALNNLGQAVGESIVNSGEWHAIIWDVVNGARDLNDLVELPPDFIFDSATDINDNGWIIGSGHYGAWSPPRAVVLIPFLIPGDIDGDGDLDLTDRDLFVDVLLGTNTDPDHVARSDLNADGNADGDDIPVFTTALLNG